MHMVKQTFAVFILVLVVSSLAGCVTIGRDFKADKISNIEIGKTTKFDLVAMFGSPFRRGLDNGKETWTYVLNNYTVLSGVKSKDLYLVFDSEGIVSSYTFNTNFPGELE